MTPGVCRFTNWPPLSPLGLAACYTSSMNKKPMTIEEFDRTAAQIWENDDCSGKQFELWLSHVVTFDENAEKLLKHYEETL